MIADRSEKIKVAIAQLKTIAELRRAYFLPEWSPYLNVFDKLKAPGEMELQRNRIGNDLRKLIVVAAQNRDEDNLLGLAIMIAEMAETEIPIEVRKDIDTCVRRVTKILEDVQNGH